jgi:hypothetical protein
LAARKYWSSVTLGRRWFLINTHASTYTYYVIFDWILLQLISTSTHVFTDAKRVRKTVTTENLLKCTTDVQYADETRTGTAINHFNRRAMRWSTISWSHFHDVPTVNRNRKWTATNDTIDIIVLIVFVVKVSKIDDSFAKRVHDEYNMFLLSSLSRVLVQWGIILCSNT